VRRNQFNAMVNSQPKFKRITVVCLVSNQTRELLISDKHLVTVFAAIVTCFMRLGEADAMCRAIEKPLPSATYCHDLRTFASLGRSNFIAPF
jgi:hypothetical protein